MPQGRKYEKSDSPVPAHRAPEREPDPKPVPRKAVRRMVVATTSFSAEVDGVPTSVTPGELFDSAHPIVVGREHLFDETTSGHPEVESATAAPGEKR